MAQIKKQTSREMVEGEDNDEHPEITSKINRII